MGISKTSCAALVISIVALVFAVWPLIFPTRGASLTPYIYHVDKTIEISQQDQILELQCYVIDRYRKPLFGEPYGGKFPLLGCDDLRSDINKVYLRDHKSGID